MQGLRVNVNNYSSRERFFFLIFPFFSKLIIILYVCMCAHVCVYVHVWCMFVQTCMSTAHVQAKGGLKCPALLLSA